MDLRVDVAVGGRAAGVGWEGRGEEGNGSKEGNGNGDGRSREKIAYMYTVAAAQRAHGPALHRFKAERDGDGRSIENKIV